jgi:hypothetical protein
MLVCYGLMRMFYLCLKLCKAVLNEIARIE